MKTACDPSGDQSISASSPPDAYTLRSPEPSTSTTERSKVCVGPQRSMKPSVWPSGAQSGSSPSQEVVGTWVRFEPSASIVKSRSLLAKAIFPLAPGEVACDVEGDASASR